jgi:hypothetical protein
LNSSGTTAFGPNRQFAATQHHACYGRRSGLSSDVAARAVPDPKRTSTLKIYCDPQHIQ